MGTHSFKNKEVFSCDYRTFFKGLATLKTKVTGRNGVQKMPRKGSNIAQYPPEKNNNSASYSIL